MTFNDFILAEQASKDTIDVKRIYIDMANDLVAGILLSQIIYWYLPDYKGNSKLRVEHEGHQWIAKKRSDWWDECRITEKQYDRAIAILEEKKFVITDTTLFAGKPSKVIRLDIPAFITAYEAELHLRDKKEDRHPAEVNPVITEKVIPLLPKGEQRYCRKVDNVITERVNFITETTTENITNNIKPASPNTGDELFNKNSLTFGEKKKPSKVRHPLFKIMSEVLAGVTHMNLETSRAYIGKTANNLLDAGYTPDQIGRWYGSEAGWWYSENWLGVKGNLPSLAMIEKTILQASDGNKITTKKSMVGGFYA